jgi:CheY-like chemotaxis protein
LTNLIGNAIKFTEQGEVMVSVQLVHDQNGDATARFEVKDTGIGVKPEALDLIFESFAQADGSTTRQYGGSGLGLTICKQLVQLMGGELGVESQVAHGSTFWVNLPLQAESSFVASRSMPVFVGLRGTRVLAVDDNATNREILSHQLSAWGVEHHLSVDSGMAAIQALREATADGQAYELAILDQHMPRMDGIELAQRIKRDPAIADLHLVMMSSVGDLNETGRWMGAGITAYLTKPVRQSELYNCLVRVLAGSESGVTPANTAHRATSPEGLFDANVLVAEDNAVNQELALHMLEDLGCRARAVGNGRLALEAFQQADGQDRYDLILMDCHMPEMDGFQATAAIRQSEYTDSSSARIPIIALTADALEGDREKCLAAGMDDYLSKPYSQKQLQQAIERWLPKKEAALG